MFLLRKLDANHEMRAAVHDTILDFDSWLSDSKLPFFQDYTDHGATHLSEVLETAVSLLSTKAKKLFTAEDAGVFILAVLLHDAALHLSEAGFYELIRGRSARDRRIEGLDEATWPDLWQSFLFSASRWDDRKRLEVFGESNAGGPPISVNDPFQSYGNLRESDRKLIGEFIRQHHPRLAHEFAIFGVPGPGGDPIKPSSRFGAEKKDLAGLTARSHGSPLRDNLVYLSRKYHPREYQYVHAVFLMVLLRIADYLQIQSSRSSEIKFRFKTISSPLSRMEHRAHRAITNITKAAEDPETIDIQAEPDDLDLFLLVKERLAGLQGELDVSWAVLGEVYGRYKTLAEFGLNLRRVRSNLDDLHSFTLRAPYFPDRVEFSVADMEILKLLVRPLYGDHPEIGIRELLQNAVDAVREREIWQAQHAGFRDVPLIRQDGAVEIWLNQTDDLDLGSLIVSDQGIGMTEQVVRDYFLRVGASYRYSQEWQREFESESSSGEPRSRVLRSGRFGIGVLAGFLLGDEIEVSTRHITSSRGFVFRTGLQPGPIELRYDEDLPVGTTIKVSLREHLYTQAEAWDWYCFEFPRVIRRMGPKGTVLPQRPVRPEDPNCLPIGWYRIDAPGFAAVYIAPSEVGEKRQQLVCNGIKIGNRTDTINPWFESGRGEFHLAAPATVVLDPDGLLPLNLTRTELTEEPPFLEEIERVACESLLAGMLVNAPRRKGSVSTLQYLDDRFKRSWENMVSFSPWLSTSEGVTLSTPWNILQTGIDRVLIDFSEDLELIHSSPAVQKGYFIYGHDEDLDVLFLGTPLDPLDLKGFRLLVTAAYGKHIMRLARNETYGSVKKLRKEWSDGTWTLLAHGECHATCLDVGQLPAPGRRSSIWPVAAEWFIKRQDLEPKGLERYWQEMIRHPVIPYSLALRRKALGAAYDRLQPYLAEHEASLRGGSLDLDQGGVGAELASARRRR